jgi:hypothetical protein
MRYKRRVNKSAIDIVKIRNFVLGDKAAFMSDSSKLC